jgi:threonine/homoserine/homoserine lactone efflux protein
VAFLVGVLLGFVGSIPAAGPLLLLVIASALKKQRSRALALASGGALAESIWVMLAFGGLTRLFESHHELWTPARAVSAVLSILLGAWLVLRGTDETKPKIERGTGFLLGFGLVGTNPAFLVMWSAVATALYSNDVLSPSISSAPWLAAGAFVGIVLWFAGVFLVAGKLGERFRPATLAKVVRVLGVLLIVTGIWLGLRAFVG